MMRQPKLALVSYMLQEEGHIPIGLLTLAEVARQEGIRDIRVLDLPERGDEQAFVNALQGCDTVGFSSICSTFNQTIRLARRVKAANPATLILLGGPQASLTARETMSAFPFVDVIFLDEAEISWRAFLRGLPASSASLAAIDGLAWRDSGEIRQNPRSGVIKHLGELPFPALDLYPFPRNASVTPVEIGRGCPFACSFCASSPHFRRSFRLKPVARILEEMDRMHDAYGSRSFYFVQDSFSVRRAFVEELCAALQRHHRPYQWYCSARADQMPEDLAVSMQAAGCRGVYFGLETGSQRMQKVINKNLDVEDALNVLRRTSALGLEVTTSMITGFPYEEPSDLRDTLRAFLDLKAAGHPLVQLHVLAPMIGSELSRQGYELHYDGMPSDFSDTAHVMDEEDRALVGGHPEIFASFWHYQNPSISRQRFLFVTHFLTLVTLHFPNTLCLAARHGCDDLVDLLLRGEIPPGWFSRLPEVESESLLGLAGEILEDLVERMAPGEALRYALQYDRAYSRVEMARQPDPIVLLMPEGIGRRPGRRVWEGLCHGGRLESYVVRKLEGRVQVLRLDHGAHLPPAQALPADDAAKTIEALCSACGECCFAPGGILCGADEWPAISRELAKEAGHPPAVREIDGAGLLVVQEYRRMPCPGPAEGGEARTRPACPALRLQQGRWRCSIEDVKPAGCVAYPLSLVLHEEPRRAAHWLISLEFDGRAARVRCPLEQALRASPQLLERYREYVGGRVGARDGTFCLAAFNQRQKARAAALAGGRR